MYLPKELLFAAVVHMTFLSLSLAWHLEVAQIYDPVPKAPRAL